MLRVASIATIVFALVAVLLSGHPSDAASVEIASDGVNQSRTLHQIVKSQRRFVLYNSRQLSGECLDVCVPTSRTDPPVPPVRTDPPVAASTLEPTREPSLSPTADPTKSPTKSPTAEPTKSPTKSPTAEPTKSPTKSPTAEPTKSPTKSPTAEPTKSPTKSPTAEPTKSPTMAPTGTICRKQKAINVCIAIDNSGSICSVGSTKLCDSGCTKNNPFDEHDNLNCHAGTEEYVDNGGTLGKKSCCGNNQMVKDFAVKYIDYLEDSEGSVSVVNFANEANVIASQKTKNAAKNAINNRLYTGGFTNTENAIDECTKQVQDLDNPVIVLITDGTPTACTLDDNGNWAHKWQNSGEKIKDCRYGNTAEKAATNRANQAAKVGVTIVPVVITSVTTTEHVLEGLARCPKNSTPSECNVEDFNDKLHVEKIDEIEHVLENLVKLTGCEDE